MATGLKNEEDLLNDGGTGLFKHEEDEIDEEALLGLGDDDGLNSNYLVDDIGDSGYGQQQDEMLDIAVDEEEIDKLEEEEDSFSVKKTFIDAEDEETEVLDYNDDIPQGEEVCIEYGNSEEQSAVESGLEVSQNESGQHVSFLQSSLDDSCNLTMTTGATAADSESESEGSDGEKKNRGRFKSERSGMISISKVKSRTDIPDTLEVSAEQQAQLQQFPARNQRGRGRNDRGRNDRGRGRNQPKFQERGDNRQGGGPVRVNHGPRHMQGGSFRPGLIGSPPRFGPGRGLQNRMPQHQNRVQGLPFGLRLDKSVMHRPPLMSLVQSPGNRMPLPTHPGRLNMVRLEQGGMPLMVPGQLLPRNELPRPALLQPTSQPFQQPPPQPMFKAVSPVAPAPARPHNIHINPNFRGNTPGGPQAIPSLVQPQTQFSPPSLSPAARMSTNPLGVGERPGLLQDSKQPLLPGQAQTFSQSQGFQQGPRMMGINARPGQVPHQARFASPNQGIAQPMSASPGRLPSPVAGFPGQPQNQAQFDGSQSRHGQNIGATPPPGYFHEAPPPQQQQQARPEMFTSGIQRRLGTQQQRVTPQNRSTLTAAKKLSLQARNAQKARGIAQAVNKNITVVPLKRHSSENETSISPKVAKTSGQSVAEEPGDEELKRGLEEQKKLREMIRKRKEEARRRQAAERRKELESRLNEKGLSIADVEGSSLKEVSGTTGPVKATPQEQEAQQISTVVTRGGKKQLISSSKRKLAKQQQELQTPVPAKQQKFHHQQQFDQQPQEQFHGHPPPHMFSPHVQQQQQQQQLFQQPVQNRPQQSIQNNRPQQLMQASIPRQPMQAKIPRQPMQANRPRQPVQISPIVAPRQSVPQNRAPVPVQFQSPKGIRQSGPPRHHFPPPNQPPPQQHLPQQSGDAFGTMRQVQQQTNHFPGRGVPQGLARGQMAVRGQSQMARGRGQMVGGQGAGQVKAGRGRGAPFISAQPGTASSSSNRTVLPLGQRAVVNRRGGTAASSRTVVQRQVMAHSAPAAIRGVAPRPSTLQKVSVDNLASGTSDLEIRRVCETAGPVLDVVILDSQRKAIVTFANKVNAVQFASQWNRRLINMAVVSVTLLP